MRVPLLALVGIAAVFPAAAAAAPITPGPVTSLPLSTGSAVKARPLAPATGPQNPHMAKNPNSNIHNDTWMTDAYPRSGPLGRNLQATSGSYAPSLCGSLAFDRQGHIVSVCPSNLSAPQARVFDPKTLAVLASYDLPEVPNPPGTVVFQNFAGGGYFFLDGKDQIWSATKTSHLFVLAVSRDGRTIKKVKDYDLSKVLTANQRITSALPDFQGRVWFVSKSDGVIGVLSTKTGAIKAMTLGEDVQNSFAVDRDGVYIVSSKRMYRFRATAAGKPVIDWKVTYRNTGRKKPGQVDAGSGTTPTIMPGGYVTITDNADPMNVVVYRTARNLPRGKRRVVCEVPVFTKGASATENSIMVSRSSAFVENNYGYQDPFGPTAGAPTTAGFARVDAKADGSGCRKVWENRTSAAPTVVPKLSTTSGLIYTYIAPTDPAGVNAWFWAAIDARNGKEVWRTYAGSGLSFNNNYAGLAIGPDGTAYLGAIGGLLALRDG